MKGFIVDASAETIDEKTEIHLFGRLENGQSFAAVNTLAPYLFIEKSDLKKVKNLLEKFKVEETDLTNFNEDPVIKISSGNLTDLNKLSKAIHKKEVNTYEADIKPVARFLIDNDILAGIEIEGHYETAEKVDRVYYTPQIKPADFKPKLKIVSLDIESDKKFHKLFCIGLCGEGYKKSFIISDKKIPGSISCKDEPELLEKFRQELIDFDPDIITGWHVIDFDLMYLKKKFDQHKIPFDLGRNNAKSRIKVESGFFRTSTAVVPGRQVLDALNMIKDPFIKEAPTIKNAKFDSYTLESVSQEILGEGKLLKGKARHNDIEELYKSGEHKKLIEYNLQDCHLAYSILEKTKTIDLALERATLTGLPLNKITASIAAFDSLYIREARKKGLVSPTTFYKERGERIKGGYVMDAKPGIHHNVLVLDFKSLYPSIMKTFNIDPASFIGKKPSIKDPEKVIEAPNGAYFKNQEGILPEILDKLHKAREKAKKEERELSSYAIKIIMNSFFGVLASPNCRYFSLEVANAITHFGQFIIKLAAKKIEEKGYKVIYSDTDSIFLETNLGKEKADKLGKEIQKYINSFYDDYVKKNYARNSSLELEFEKQYLAFLLPPVRGSEGSEVGSKKRYAGLIEKNGKEKIEIVGLEAIRGDWTQAAQEFQTELLNKIFHKEEFVPFIREYVKKLNEGKLDEKLVYKKSIRKSLERYTKTTPPHVKAARQLDTLDSNIIKYYITTAGPEPVQKHKHQIDYKHYIDKQIKPIADTVLFFFHKDFKEIIESSKQMKLF